MRVYTLGRDSAANLVAEKHLEAHQVDPPEVYPGVRFTKGLLYGTLLSLPFWIGIILLVAS